MYVHHIYRHFSTVQVKYSEFYSIKTDIIFYKLQVRVSYMNITYTMYTCNGPFDGRSTF